MKAYRFEICVLDFENYGPEEYKVIIEQAKHLSGTVMSLDEIDIGEWDDDHPLNNSKTARSYFEQTFQEQAGRTRLYRE